MTLSFVIPAHNEERLLSSTIRAIRIAIAALGEECEVLVVDDDSSDRTADIAIAEGARVISVRHLQIAATRHAGAHAARGDLLVFVDADTLISAAVVREALDAIAQGAAGGAALGVFDGKLPYYAKALASLWSGLARTASLTTGCFLFCRRTAYEAVGGFDRSLFVFEDVAFGRSLRRAGRVVILRETVSTSGRNLRAHSLRDAVRMLLLLARHRGAFFTSRDGLGYWYGSRR
jgi:glycosyltransferase involved in cell wall biosynthesis